MVYLISDTHFNHKAIIEYEDRPFKDVEEMNETMIANWNSVISKRDTVIHAGDFGWGNKEIITKLRSRLNGRIILIKGNHDAHSNQWYMDAGFDEVIDGGYIYKNFYMISHKPMYLNNHMPYVNIHGHIHSQTLKSKQFINVSVEHINYTPIPFETIMERVEKDFGEM